MKDTVKQIKQHYNRPHLYEDIIAKLKGNQVDLNIVGRADIAGVDEFHVRGAEVSRELADSVDIKNKKLLDIGCGIGGPCRMLADEYGCHATGIDLSEEFVRTAGLLSELVGISDKTKFIHGNALKLPFEDNSFDIVWTQHVQMNIEDKLQFYAEIKRVLTENGLFLYYDIFKKGDLEIGYPMPWAEESNISFLFRSSDMNGILTRFGFTKGQSKDQTDNGVSFFKNMLEKIIISGPPKLGLNVLMGESTKTKIINLLSALEDGRLMLQSGVYMNGGF